MLHPKDHLAVSVFDSYNSLDKITISHFGQIVKGDKTIWQKK